MKLHPANPTPGLDKPEFMLTYTKNEPHNRPAYYAVFYTNGVKIGDIDMENDGYYYFYPVLNPGFWEASVLHDVARKLDALNEAWNQRLEIELKRAPMPHVEFDLPNFTD